MTKPHWLTIAERYDGLAEIPGPKSNPTILEMARAIGAPAWYHNDDQPWCAVFQNFVLLQAGLRMAIGQRGDAFDRLRALTFFTDTTWGVPLSGPALGAIAVFSRPEGAHVGMYLGEHAKSLIVYGGNQKNRVCAMLIERKRLKGYYWPQGVPLPAIAAIQLPGFAAGTSTNEA